MKQNSITTIFTTILLTTLCFSQDNILVDINNIYPEDVVIAGFVLDNDQEIKIEVSGIHREDKWDKLILGTAWILNSASRELVWSFEPDDFRGRKYKVKEQVTKLKLPAGTYEVYYSSYPYFSDYDSWDHHWRRNAGKVISRFFNWIFEDDERYYARDLFRKFKITVRGGGKKLNEDQVLGNIDHMKTQYLISLSAERDNQYLTRGFRLSQPAEITIYAQGEARDDGNFDYGWIVDLKTHQKVWELDYWDADHAGGAEKNRTVKQAISLPAGEYGAIYVTDDSHSPRDWNSAPAYDPYFWGMYVSSADRRVNQYFKEFDYSLVDKDDIIFSLTPMRDDDLKSKGFTLKKPMNLRVFAIGEGRDDEMFDYAWIVDAKTHQRIWEMDYRNTEHAGGSQKNRLFDDLVKFEKGNYIAYYITDGSHSYRHWNASRPFLPEYWGLTILLADEKASKKDIAEFEEKDDPAVLVKIIGVRDNNYKKEKFTLKKKSRVRIYALGEGMRGRMYDYAWIEDVNTGKVIWEMSYRMTDHAGGDRKNRLYNNTVLLEKGEYLLFYESDDSHSYNHWNASPPHDPVNYGITLSLED